MKRLTSLFTLTIAIFTLEANAVTCIYRQATFCQRANARTMVNLIDIDVNCYTGTALSQPRVYSLWHCTGGQIDPQPQYIQYLTTYSCRELGRSQQDYTPGVAGVFYSYDPQTKQTSVRDNCGP